MPFAPARDLINYFHRLASSKCLETDDGLTTNLLPLCANARRRAPHCNKSVAKAMDKMRWGIMRNPMKHLNPWKTTDTRVVYDNAWIAVREDQVIRPDGNPGIYGVVQYKNKAIGVLPIDAEGNIYLVGQFRYALGLFSWEIPEGGCPENEDPLEAAQRELLEETGLKAANWQELGRSHLSNSVSDELAIYYLATGLQQGAANPDGTEELTLKHVPFAEAVAMVGRGEITDSLSMLAIMHYALMRNGKLAAKDR
jgi:8-oxo-dGTP pyrophosphatase MutT (NUDIX family)